MADHIHHTAGKYRPTDGQENRQRQTDTDRIHTYECVCTPEPFRRTSSGGMGMMVQREKMKGCMYFM